MGNRQLIALLSAATLALAAVCPSSQRDSVSGDTNGDHRVDVLDIQAVLDATIAERRDNTFTDVNGDGETNILDLQLTQTQATGPAEGRNVADDRVPPKACHFANPPFPSADLHRPLVLVTLSQSSAPPRPPRSNADVGIRDSRTERYLYRLTSNAPPSCA